MFYDDSIAGSWTALVTRLDRRATVARWAEGEPVLATFHSVCGIASALDAGRDSDALIGALVRLAAVDGHSDDDALLVLLHCLSGLVLALARDLRDLHEDIVVLVVGELTCQIRDYLRRGRTRAFAENLRWETRRALLAELRPRVRNHPEWAEVLTADGDIAALAADTVSGRPDDDLDSVDLLRWSVRSGVDAGGICLLVETEQARAEFSCAGRGSRDVDRRVAHAHGMCERTLYRRRARTLAALRAAAVEYLAAVA